MAADLVLGVLQLTVPVVIETIKGLCKLITEKHQEREGRDEPVEGLEESLEKLSFNVSLFKSLQQGSADKQDVDENSLLQIWLEKLKETLCDAEDLLDGYATDIAIREIEEKEDPGSAVIDAAPGVTDAAPVSRRNLMAKGMMKIQF